MPIIAHTHHFHASLRRIHPLRAVTFILICLFCLSVSTYADSTDPSPQPGSNGWSRYYYYPSTSSTSPTSPTTSTSPSSTTVSNNGLYSGPNFYPIAVWDQSPTASAVEYRNIGINTFIAMPHPTTSADISALTSNGMALIGDQDSTAMSASSSIVRSWRQIDEPDGAKISKGRQIGCNASPSDIQQKYKSMKAADPLHRPVYINFTGGVANPGQDSCKTASMYRQYIAGADIVSFDLYAVNSGLPLTHVARGMDNLRAWAGNKPAYIWIETTAYNGGPAPTPKQTKAQVWMAIVHGANGIGYFCHIFKPSEIEAGLLSSPTMSRAVAAVNAQISSLAPVINSPTIPSGASVQSSGRVDVMTKSYGGATYVFAVGMSSSNTTTQISLPSQSAGTVTVLGENRALPLANGTFSDRFAGYDVHIYRITQQ